jgi:hypothetical protein
MKKENKNKREMAETIKMSSLIQYLLLKVDPSQQGASSSSIPQWGANSSSQARKAEKIAGCKGSSVVRNIPLLSIQVAPLEASSSGIPPRVADSISQCREAEKTTNSRDSPHVRNLPSLFIEVTALKASSSGIPSWGAGVSHKPVDWSQ